MADPNTAIPFVSAKGVLYFTLKQIISWFNPDTGEYNPEIPEGLNDEEAAEFKDWAWGHIEKILVDQLLEARSEQIKRGEAQPEGMRCFEDLAALYREVKKLRRPIFAVRKNKARVLKSFMRRNNVRTPHRQSRSRTRRHGSSATVVRSGAGGGSSDGGEPDQGDPSGPHKIIPFVQTSFQKRNTLLQQKYPDCSCITWCKCGARGWAA